MILRQEEDERLLRRFMEFWAKIAWHQVATGVITGVCTAIATALAMETVVKRMKERLSEGEVSKTGFRIDFSEPP